MNNDWQDRLCAYAGMAFPVVFFVGWGLARRLHGSATVRLLDALGAVSGNLGVPGGGVSYYFQRRGGFATEWVKRPENAGARTLLEPLLGEEILRADPPVRVAVIDNGNPVSQLPESGTVAKALSSVPFLVVLDAFLTDTAELAHVVLPTTTMLEEHDVVGAYGHHWVQLNQPAVAPPPGVLSDLDIYQALAGRLDPWASVTYAGIVDDRMVSAERIHAARELARLGDVREVADHDAFGARKRAARVFGPCGVARVQRHAMPALDKQARCQETQPVRRAGDENSSHSTRL